VPGEAPKADQPVWLKRLQDSVAYTDLKVTTETIMGAECTLEIMLVKEGADWKLEDAFWAT